MAILTEWDNRDHTVILVEFESRWTWAELETAIGEIDNMIASKPHQVDVIIDLEGSSIPKDFMNAAKQLLANPEPRANEGTRIVVGANKVMRSAYAAIQKAFSSKIQGRELLFADDVDTARATLRGMRIT